MASKAFYGGVSLDQIMLACHWKAHNTFTKLLPKRPYFVRQCNNIYRGPVVAAQQVLDTSPRLLILKKEKGGGGGARLLQPSLQESNPRF